MRSLLLAGALALVPLPAAAFLGLWQCEPAQRVLCQPGEGCRAAEPRIDKVEIMPVTGRLGFCNGEQCYAGVMELEREGWPGYLLLGTARVEALPLSRRYTAGEPWFVGFDEEARRFTLSSLAPHGQDTTWFDCTPWGE